MKSLIRSISINAFSLFALSQIAQGVIIKGGLQTLIIGGFALSIMSLFLKPILKILMLPLNIATFGIFSFVINAILLYILTKIIPQITIAAFVFPGFSNYGFIIPSISFNLFFSYIVLALLLSLIGSFLHWLME